MDVKQEEIVDEIRLLCGQALPIPSLGWSFRHNGQVYFYVAGKDKDLVRFCIPFVAGLPSLYREQLKEAVNDTNRNVKFIKALLSDEDKVSLDYDYKTTGKESAKDIVPHVIMALNFAVGYLKENLEAVDGQGCRKVHIGEVN